MDYDRNEITSSLLDGALYVDGGGRGFMPLKARSIGDCMFVSLASVAFGARCKTKADGEAYSLPLRAAMAWNAIVNIEEFISWNHSYNEISFYDALASDVVSLGGEANPDELEPEQA